MSSFKEFLETLKNYNYKIGESSIKVKWENKDSCYYFFNFMEMIASAIDEGEIIFKKGKGKKEETLEEIEELNDEISELEKNIGKIKREKKEKGERKSVKELKSLLSKIEKKEFPKIMEKYFKKKIISFSDKMGKDLDEKELENALKLESHINDLIYKLSSNWFILINEFMRRNYVLNFNSQEPDLFRENHSIRNLKGFVDLVDSVRNSEEIEKEIREFLLESFEDISINNLQKVYRKWIKEEKESFIKGLEEKEKDLVEKALMVKEAYLIGAFIKICNFPYEKDFSKKIIQFFNEDLISKSNPSIKIQSGFLVITLEEDLELTRGEESEELEKRKAEVKEIAIDYFGEENISISEVRKYYETRIQIEFRRIITKEEKKKKKKKTTGLSQKERRKAIRKIDLTEVEPAFIEYYQKDKKPLSLFEIYYELRKLNEIILAKYPKLEGMVELLDFTIDGNGFEAIRDIAQRILNRNKNIYIQKTKIEKLYRTYEEQIDLKQSEIKNKESNIRGKQYKLEELPTYQDEAESGYMMIKMMDPSRIMMMNLIKTDITINRPFKIGLNFDDFIKLLKTKSQYQKQLELVFHMGDKITNRSRITSSYKPIEVKKIGTKVETLTTKTLDPLDIDIEEIPMDNLMSIEYPIKFSTSIRYWGEMLDRMGKYSDILKITADRKKGVIFEEGVNKGGTFRLEEKDKLEYPVSVLKEIKGIGKKKVETLENEGFKTFREVYNEGVKNLEKIDGISKRNAKSLIKGIKKMKSPLKLEMEKGIDKVTSSYPLEMVEIVKESFPVLEEEDPIHIELRKDHPLKIRMEYEKLGFSLLWFVAPRVEETEFDEDDMEEF
jgi:hypothetical protein